jgi:hypothetical protein
MDGDVARIGDINAYNILRRIHLLEDPGIE